MRYLKIQPTSHGCEVYLGLEGKYGKSENDGASDPHSNHDLRDFVMGGDGANHEALCQGEDTEEDEVAGGFAAHVTAAGADQHEQHHKADNHREEEEPLVFSAANKIMLVSMLSNYAIVWVTLFTMRALLT